MQPRVVLILILGSLLFACGCTSPAPSGEPAAVQVTTEPVGEIRYVSLTARSYNPEQLSIKTGTTVVWINEEPRITRRVVHLPVQPEKNVLFESGPLEPGQSYRYRFTSPGRYVYADPQHGGGRSPFIEVTD
jgi:plastocyanin